MKSIIISSNSSGGGKTTFTLGLLNLLKRKGLKVQGYKAGPDYIDPAFHSHITKSTSRNLDLFLMGDKGVKASFSRGVGEYGIIEGVMGLYDGKGITYEYSTAHLAEVLKVPVVLVLSPKAQVATLCAEILGLQNFGKVNIAGVVLNNISESYYKLLKLAIEKNCGVKVFGYLPKDETLILKSRHLGLVQSSEINDLDEKIDICSDLIQAHVDVEALMRCFDNTERYEDDYNLSNKKIRSAVAYDKAFSFYYKENLELLEQLGEVEYFSPLKDKELPKNVDFLYLGGGYPEVFIKELSENESMLKSINTQLNEGLRCYGECGGLMYLMEQIEGTNSVGFFEGKATLTSRLQNFGYAELEVFKENNILKNGSKINCHEFHRSKIESNEKKIYKVYKTIFDNSIKQWQCGYYKNNTLAAYAHVHFFGNIEMFSSLVGINLE
ncbi:cobyrinate a,c-diamide synthase [Clostridium folliculivorans]|uniref:Cobyrinate a,c-diamide synthase n=1 Tax=Clostridium folliculivorans TaxID=2886038 RepID=A0A9W5Y4A1_9CLOT|nr:cobyrinate a,c-diamide synthase [Clostridium folliculivorans]GKU26299.1 cobyrinate a,c-diamide synthase [Clostridium folliculivorans]GKU31971.1 cobyrinate a,c-diamide synthase [Clostridium folliculivorans]